MTMIEQSLKQYEEALKDKLSIESRENLLKAVGLISVATLLVGSGDPCEAEECLSQAIDLVNSSQYEGYILSPLHKAWKEVEYGNPDLMEMQCDNARIAIAQLLKDDILVGGWKSEE